jgi:hypothetical protein
VKRSHISLATFALLAATAACGGGGGSSALPPPSPGSKSPTLVTLSLKIPGPTTLAKVRRPAYVSQATQGVAIDWNSTTPTNPDAAFAVTLACPGTLPANVLSCGTDAQGNTTYTFQLPIPAGLYTITVTTFDTAPSGGAFIGNMLAQGQLGAPVTISAGVANTLPPMTFYGVPASVSFSPAPGDQQHVASYLNGYSIIGNTKQSFYAQASDADGFAIIATDTGAPVISVTQAGAHFAITHNAALRQWDFTAQSATVPGATPAPITVSASNAGAPIMGAPVVSRTVSIYPEQELWAAQQGASPGITGYAIDPISGLIENALGTVPIDQYISQSGGLCGGLACSFGTIAIDSSNVIYAVAVAPTAGPSSAPAVFKFTQGTASQPLTAPIAPSFYQSSGVLNGLAVDNSARIYTTDGSGTGTIAIYGPPLTPSSVAAASMNPAGTLGEIYIAPSIPAIPAALQQSLWIAGTGAVPLVFLPYAGTGSFPSVVSVSFSGTAPGSVSALGFDSQGRVWITDGSQVYAYSMTYTTSITLTFLASTALSFAGAYSYTFGASAGSAASQTMWIGQATYPSSGIIPYTLVCTPTCTMGSGTSAPTAGFVFSAVVEP